MQIRLMMNKFEENENESSSIISLRTSSSIGSWIVEYYFTEFCEDKSMAWKNIIGSYDMWMIFRTIRPSLSIDKFWNLCRKKLKKQIENDPILKEYDVYLNRCGSMDVVDLIHRCQSQLMKKTILLSMENIQTELDRLFFQYLLELSSTSTEMNRLQTELIVTKPTDSTVRYHSKKTSNHYFRCRMI